MSAPSSASGGNGSPAHDDRHADSNEEQDHHSGDDKGPRKAPFFRRRPVLIGGGVLLVVLIIGAVIWWWHASGYESTDDAFIDARTVRVSARISGEVTAVRVDDNQLVRQGTLILDIDPADARAAVDQAAAEEAQARTALGQSEADVVVAEAQRRQAEASAAGAQAQAVNAAQDLERYRALQASTPQAVAQGQIDQAVAAARNSAAQRDAVRQQIKSADAQIVAARAAVAGAQARIETARAQLREAQLNLGYTRVPAPVDGHIAHRTVAVGSYVSPGQQLLSIVPLHLWVTANFKETQLDRIRAGQRVAVHVDACPDVDLRAHVDSIQRGAGQAFALLPAENATGNYVKVVQRVPVKIELDELPAHCPLGPGMSVEPNVRVR